MANPISLDEYKQLLAAGQKYVTDAQANDPAWQAWKQAYDSTSWDSEKPVSPSKDYWAEYMGKLSPAQQAGFQEYMMAPTWQNKVGNVLKVAVPAAVGAAGIGGAMGLLGGSGAAAGGSGVAAGMSPAAADAALAAFDAAVPSSALDAAFAGAGGGMSLDAADAALAAFDKAVPSSSLDAAFKAAAPATKGGLTSWLSSQGALGSTAADALKWAGDNRGLVSLLGGALAAAGSGNNSGNTASKTYTPQPGMNFGTMRQTSQMGTHSTFTPQPTSGLLNSGLARYGATGGLFQPGQYRPTLYSWGK